MTKRRTHGSEEPYLDAEDSPIGLTSAFAPVKGPQSVEYAEGDEPVGLTQAFAPLPDQNEPHVWDEEGKWKDFDWNEGYAQEIDPMSQEDGEEPEAEAEGGSDEQPVAADEEKPADSSDDDVEKPSRGRHAAPSAISSSRMKKSRRTRKILIILIVLLVLLFVLVGFFAFKTFTNSQSKAASQSQQQSQSSQQTIIESASSSSSSSAASKANVPDLTLLFGKTADEAVAAIGHGALVTSNRSVDDKDSAIKTNLNVALTEEPADSKTGTPTVYLGLDKDGKVIQVGYSASASALGFGALSFADAINVEHVVEKTLAKIGVTVPEGSATLPADKASYSTYASDNTTVKQERCSFSGPVDVRGTACTWSAVLSYDYTTQITSGNLSDTVRVIYVYVSMDVEPDPED